MKIEDQHFLKDGKIIEKMIKAAELKKDDAVFEIGAGEGNITKEIAKKCRVIAVELDIKFKDELDKIENAEIIFGNALYRLDEFRFNKIISNVPFSITEPLFKKLMKKEFDNAVLLIGEKFFEIIKSDGKLGITKKIFFDAKKICDAERKCFEPEPRTECVVVKITKRKKKLTKFENLVKEVLLQDDKKVKNALMYAMKRADNLTKNEARKLIYKNIPATLLDKIVDNLSNEEFLEVYERIKKI